MKYKLVLTILFSLIIGFMIGWFVNKPQIKNINRNIKINNKNETQVFDSIKGITLKELNSDYLERIILPKNLLQ